MRIKPLSLILMLFAMNVTAQTKKETSKLLQHVVLFKFKDDAKPDDVKKVEEAFIALKSQIKEIKAVEWGLNNSPENLNQGFTHCFLVSFASEKDREIYLPHPKHKEFVATLGPVLEKALVIDYWQR